MRKAVTVCGSFSAIIKDSMSEQLAAMTRAENLKFSAAIKAYLRL